MILNVPDYFWALMVKVHCCRGPQTLRGPGVIMRQVVCSNKEHYILDIGLLTVPTVQTKLEEAAFGFYAPQTQN